ncbi:MAG: PAS domain-containing protein [Rhodocyclaceae bacterium]|nr:PAS domain-containing protein [Rhodocyclaceae bacterium]
MNTAPTYRGTLNPKALFSALVPALLIAALSIYAFGYRTTTGSDEKILPGKPLASYDEYYPVRANANGLLYLDKERFEKAVDYFSGNTSPRAAADLIYLGNSNHVELMLNDPAKKKYLALANLPNYAAVAKVDEQKDSLLRTYKDIVDGIGQTFSGTPIEIVLHDARNPLISIVAVQNPISGRRIGDPNTNFGIRLIRTYSQSRRSSGQAYVSYSLTLTNGTPVKSTTVPLFDRTYGLIGMICMNIDISTLDPKKLEAAERFLDAFRHVTPNEEISEMIESSKRTQ